MNAVTLTPRLLAALVLAAGLTAAPLVAQHQHHQPAEPEPQHQHHAPAPADDHAGHEMGAPAGALDTCHDRSRQALMALAAAEQSLEGARAANDPARLRQVTEQVQLALAEVRQQLTQCVDAAVGQTANQ